MAPSALSRSGLFTGLVVIVLVTGCLTPFAFMSAPRLAQPRTSAKPVLVLMELNPWLMVIGSDSATFALYEDGTVLYRERDEHGQPGRMLAAKLTQREREELLAKLKPDRLDSLKERYETVRATDQVTTVLITWPSGKARSVSVYGPFGQDPVPQAPTSFIGSFQGPDRAPAPFVEIVESLRRFSAPGASEWTPEVVELMVGSFDYAEKSVPWPGGWPDLSSPGAVQPGKRSVGKLFLDGRDLPQLRAFFRSLGESTAVVMNGRKMSLNLRFVIPGEELWNAAVPKSH